MSRPLISVIVPMYKVEKYLRKCLDSIINQTYDNLQIILVDDGSPDDCGKISDEYAQKDSRIEVIHKKNGGLSDARNVGLEAAKGEYVEFVDSDDYIAEDMCEHLLKLVQENNADVSICNFYIVNESDGEKTVRNPQNETKNIDKLDVLKEILLDKNIQSYAWNKLWKKSLFDDIKFPVGKRYEDIGTTFYLLEKCEKIVLNGAPKYYYLNRAGSIVNDVKAQTIIDYVGIIVERFDYVKEKLPSLSKYNNYYLAKTLLTAKNDYEIVKDKSPELDEIMNLIYEKLKEMTKDDFTEFYDLLNDEQKEALSPEFEEK